MKKILCAIFVCLFMCINVYAETHDVQAKYETSYNVNLVTATLNNDTKTIEIDDYSLELSTTIKNIEVVIIKVQGEENDYVKSFTSCNDNYYIGFFKNGEKISTSGINIDIKNNDKVLNIYDNQGKIVEVSNNKINLNENNYFMTVSNKIVDTEDNYKIVDIDSLVEDIEDIELNDNSNIQVYNSKDILIENNKNLGTGYKVIINNLGSIIEYKIIAKGDITGDAKIDLNDITRLYHYYKKIEEMDDVFILAGDVADNDIINLNDITKLYHYYKKIIPNL